ncbi:HAD family hydrolase [Siculibacillus lacustris]|uniref:HAD family hydrolase n=1 Tax=Siculibacillus lacustris TaxID=1549641 RepID=A0A4Q9VS18_9HYPH|nr:HAD family hydrolase [Siculibacillus lacustris]TBW38732.1 HAD family hydrolase [Siculibacillus lacustris]
MSDGIRAILFDKDGTLLDFWPSWGPIAVRAGTHAARGDAALAERLLAVAGIGLDGRRADPDSVFAAGSAADIARVWIAAGAPGDVDSLTHELDAIFCAAVGDVVPVGDLAAILGRLARRGYRLGIASSDGEAAIRATVERFGLEGLIDFVAGWDSGHGGKPGPGMVLAFCRAIGVAPEAVAVVGDTLHDLAMARAADAGLRVAVLTGTGTRARLAAEADVVLGSIAELEALLVDPAAAPAP